MATETHHTLLAKGYALNGFGNCKSCHAAVRWYITPAQKWIPYDSPQAATDTPEAAPFAERPLTPHWATCPNARQHRKPKPAAKPQPTLFAEVR